MADTAAHSDDVEIVYTSRITRELAITDRCLRKWIRAGRFPEPDVNILGRNAWRLASYRLWKAGMLAGNLRQDRRPPNLRSKIEPECA